MSSTRDDKRLHGTDGTDLNFTMRLPVFSAPKLSERGGKREAL